MPRVVATSKGVFFCAVTQRTLDRNRILIRPNEYCQYTLSRVIVKSQKEKERSRWESPSSHYCQQSNHSGIQPFFGRDLKALFYSFVVPIVVRKDNRNRAYKQI